MPANERARARLRGHNTGSGITAALAALLLTTGCERRPDSGPVVVSAIGGLVTLGDVDRQPLDTPSRLLIDSTAQGLVRFDATGQIEPGLAERWIVIDDGMTYIFRLRGVTWANGSAVTADQIVTLLRRHVAPRSRNPLAPFLTAIDTIVAMTPQVIEIRLKRPRPDLLSLFAQPEMGLLRVGEASGSGPFRVAQTGTAPLLRPVIDPDRVDPDAPPSAPPEHDVRLRGERASTAVLRFAARRSDLVMGGSFVDYPLLASVEITPASLRIDPAAGLFGLAVVSREGFLAEATHRDAISAAIDRAAVTGAIAEAWAPAQTVLPDQLDSGATPATPLWASLPLVQRRAAAAALVQRWEEPVRLRIAVPRGPGATLIFGQIAASLAAVGVGSERVAPDAPADLKLVDAVAPYDSARWYLANACQPCSAEADAALTAARDAPDMATRAQRIAAADVAITQDASFIPIARPLRWSLVALRLQRWTANARAWHPLNRLREDTTSGP